MPGPPVAKVVAARSAGAGAASSSSTSLAITNPLVLYRTLVATKRIQPDPAQHRLALQLQKLYFRLKDYRPEVEYRRRLERVARGVTTGTDKRASSTGDGAKAGPRRSPSSAGDSSNGEGGFMSSLLARHRQGALTAETRALTRRAPSPHDSALTIDSPRGLLLYGGVGRGKSMLLDLLFGALPTEGKRRWHFSTFMLDVFRRLERERVARMRMEKEGRVGVGEGLLEMEQEHVVLALARETVETSPVLFLDEFQMPDRASSRLVNGFLTGFFGLGGVLVASSNRMPEELSKGQGVRFADPYWGGRQQWRWGRGGWVGWFGGAAGNGGRPPDETERFVEALKARCEIWEMEGQRDWRREEIEEAEAEALAAVPDGEAASVKDAVESTVSLSVPPESSAPAGPASSDMPPHYHLSNLSLTPSDSHLPTDIAHLNPSGKWEPLSMTIYGRTVNLPTTHSGILLTSFADLCTRHLGPADYVSVCARFHSIVLTEIPVLTNTMKNEARRLIWLIDAMYEAGVRLVVSAEAPVDKLFFPEQARSQGIGSAVPAADDEQSSKIAPDSDSIESEAMSEMYQDSTAPFRPNVASYGDGGGEWRSANPTYAPGRADVRNMLADEDADFGPTYGNGRGHGMGASDEQMGEMLRRQGMGDQVVESEGAGGALSVGVAPDFTDTRVLVGEDEKFAYRRARSRLWEMCGRRWWRVREGDPAQWWRPEGGQGRFWEAISDEDVEKVVREEFVDGSHDGGPRRVDALRDAEDGSGLFRHGASPYRTAAEAPPKFGWQHAWGMMRWGKKAGEWGKGIEGDRSKDGSRVADGKDR